MCLLDVATPGQIKLVSVQGYDAWATLKGLDGSNNDPASDADKDGTSNLMEFYLDGNPLANDPSILPVSTLDATYLKLSQDLAKTGKIPKFVGFEQLSTHSPEFIYSTPLICLITAVCMCPQITPSKP